MNKLVEVAAELIPNRYVANRIAIEHCGHDGAYTFAYVVHNKHNVWLIITVDGRTLAHSKRKAAIMSAAKIVSPYSYVVHKS